ncbi:hypothetical protein MHF_1604 [Mycoplasma haemofelis Ohio2]|uniref:Uncharacterized protein n=1 Tax=Mycoplasma haemofelis (strain Ohio2) TaxID=859194 RepID=F6FHS0_MYCHI|nr:hypothetical protein MHF_1604 [Mycoplasma haemofelis Ohio2]
MNLDSIKKIFLFEKAQNLPNLRKLGILYSFSNIFTSVVFYIWFILHSQQREINSLTIFLITAIIVHFYLALLFINWSLPYEGAKWMMWGWLTIVFISPLGIGLLFICNNKEHWENKESLILETNKSILHSFGNSFVNLSKNLDKAMKYLLGKYPQEMQHMMDNYWGITADEVESLDNKNKFLILALAEGLRQHKKKATFKELVFDAHWYDQRYFDFALKDPRSDIMPLKYKYLLAFLVLDEFNNYQKIVDGKKEIKKNLKFSPAKIICLHWGKGYKIYVNE